MLKFLLSRIPDNPKPRPRILLIDDDRDIRTVTSLVLMTSDFGTVHEAATGRAGLEMARTCRPDVILLDMKMPDIGGETVLQLLKADPWTQHIPVILFTANRHAGRLRALPVADVVLKPFQPSELCESIRCALRTPPSKEAVAMMQAPGMHLRPAPAFGPPA